MRCASLEYQKEGGPNQQGTILEPCASVGLGRVSVIIASKDICGRRHELLLWVVLPPKMARAASIALSRIRLRTDFYFTSLGNNKPESLVRVVAIRKPIEFEL